MTGSPQDSSDGTLQDALSETDWAEAPTDPHPERNLDYKLADWEVVTPSRDSDQVVFLPEDEEMLRNEAFVISERASLCSLDQHR